MSDVKISELPVATDISLASFAGLQSGATKQFPESLFAAAFSPLNLFSIYPSLRDAVPVSGFSPVLAIGHNDIYTAPANRTAIIFNGKIVNDTSGTINYFAEAKHNGTYYRASTTGTALAGLTSGLAPLSLLINSGDSLSVNTGTTNGGYAVMSIIEFSSLSTLKAPQIFGLQNGDNTLYTCPSGKAAMLTGFSVAMGLRFTINVGIGAVAPGQCIMKVVKSGGDPSLNLETPTLNSINTSTGFTSAFSITAGDSIIFNATTGDAAQSVYSIFTELDA